MTPWDNPASHTLSREQSTVLATCVFGEGRKYLAGSQGSPQGSRRGLENTFALLVRVCSPIVPKKEGQCSVRGFEKSIPANLEEEHPFPVPGNLAGGED